MANTLIQSSLTGGELGPSLWGRVDVARYSNSLKLCRNFIVYPFGGVKNRPGTGYVVTAKDSTHQVRVIPWVFNETQTYVLEFGEKYVRICQNGGQVVATSTPAWVTGTAYTVGDIVSSGGTNYYCKVAHTSGTFATDLAAGDWVALTGAIVEIPTPYLGTELAGLKWAQSADLLVIVHPNHPPMGLGRYSNQKWALTALELDSGPFQDINANKAISVSCSANIGDITLTSTAALFSAANVGQLFYLAQRDFGQAWMPGTAVNSGDIRRADGKYYKALLSGTTGQNIPTGTLERWHDGGVDWAYLHSGFGVCRITSVTDSTHANATVLSYMPTGATGVSYLSPLTISSATANSDGSALLYIPSHGLTVGTYGNCAWYPGTAPAIGAFGVLITNYPTPLMTVVDANHVSVAVPYSMVSNALAQGTFGIQPPNGANIASTYTWAWGAFNDPSVGGPGYPAAVAFHQQRLLFAGTANQPNTLWMSRTGDYYDFSVSSPVEADDTIDFTLASMRLDQVQAMLPLQQLVVFTAGGEWAMAGPNNDAMDATAPPIAKLQGFHGCASVQPVSLGNSALFLQTKNQNIRDLAYDWALNAYAATDLTVFAPHLFEGHQVLDWAYHQAPYSCVWCVREDGALLGFTYFKEQQVAAWHRHDTQGGLFEAVCVVGEGTEDFLYAVVNRSGARMIERMSTRVITDVKDAFFVDAGLSFDGRNTGATTMTVSGGTNWDETETLTLNASAAAFAYPATSDVGDVVQFEDDVAGIVYRLQVLSVASTTQATVRANRQLPVTYRNTARTDWAWARNTFSGLSHLNGQTVSILADGNVQAQQVVSAGTVTINPPGARVHVGLPITAQLETLDLSIPGIETILPKQKTIPKVRFLVNETQVLKAGRDFNHLFENKARSTENYDQPINLNTGIAEILMASSWGTSGSVCVQEDQPTPVGVLAILPVLGPGGAV